MGAGTSRAATIESVRVVAVDPSRSRLTIANTRVKSGRQVLTVSRDARGVLRTVRAGDDVVLSYRPGGHVVVRIEPMGISSGGVTRVSNVTTATARPSTVVVTTPSVGPMAVGQGTPPATGGIPLPPNAPGYPAQMQPVPNVGPPTSPGVNVALPPTATGTVTESTTAAQADAIRSQALRDFQASSGVLALKANEIDGLWFAFKDLCLRGTTPSGAATTTGREWFILFAGASMPPPTDDACRQRLSELNRAANVFQEQLGVTTDIARKADLPPGTMREILQKNRIDR
jgi:hypothetical protein